jgi:hypothetical protein
MEALELLLSSRDCLQQLEANPAALQRLPAGLMCCFGAGRSQWLAAARVFAHIIKGSGFADFEGPGSLVLQSALARAAGADTEACSRWVCWAAALDEAAGRASLAATSCMRP